MDKINNISLADYDIPLERDGFMRELLRHLSGTLQEVVGVEEASGFISLVGQKMGVDINNHYCAALNVSKLSRTEVAAVLVDLKRRIQGDFRIISEDEEKIVLENSACPFAEKVDDRKSLCMMTSNVFGTISAENLGYAKVHIDKTIAEGDGYCRVIIYLTHSEKAQASTGNEYYQG